VIGSSCRASLPILSSRCCAANGAHAASTPPAGRRRTRSPRPVAVAMGERPRARMRAAHRRSRGTSIAVRAEPTAIEAPYSQPPAGRIHRGAPDRPRRPMGREWRTRPGLTILANRSNPGQGRPARNLVNRHPHRTRSVPHRAARSLDLLLLRRLRRAVQPRQFLYPVTGRGRWTSPDWACDGRVLVLSTASSALVSGRLSLSRSLSSWLGPDCGLVLLAARFMRRRKTRSCRR
jgi:hypothetical protein